MQEVYVNSWLQTKLLPQYLTWTSFPRRVSTGFHGFLASKCTVSKMTSSLWGSWCIRMCSEATNFEFTLIAERCPQSHMCHLPAATRANSGRRWRDGGRSALPKWNCWIFKEVKGISSLRCPRRNEQWLCPYGICKATAEAASNMPAMCSVNRWARVVWVVLDRVSSCEQMWKAEVKKSILE